MLFNKFLPILLLFSGCLNAPTDNHVAPQNTAEKKVERPGSLVSIFSSNDHGHNWSPIGEGLPQDLQLSQLDTLGQQLVVGTSNYGVYLSDPGKQSWQQLDTTTLPTLKITSLHVANGVIYVGLHEQGIYATQDLGKTWASMNYNLTGEWVKSILRVGNELLIGTDRAFFALSDGTTVWRKTFDKANLSGLLKIGNNIVAGTYEGIISSSDNGGSWHIIHKDFKPSRMFVIDGKIIATQYDYPVEFSEDMGKTWRELGNGFGNSNQVLAVAKIGNRLMSYRNDGIFQAEGWNQEWKPIYRFSSDKPYSVLLNWGEQWNEVFTRPEAPFTDVIITDGVVYGGTVRGC